RRCPAAPGLARAHAAQRPETGAARPAGAGRLAIAGGRRAGRGPLRTPRDLQGNPPGDPLAGRSGPGSQDTRPALCDPGRAERKGKRAAAGTGRGRRLLRRRGGAHYVAKHARASTAYVDVDVHDDALRLRVRDDGVGGADPARGSGLIGLDDRVEALGGTMQIDSPAGKGTALLVTLPIASA